MTNFPLCHSYHVVKKGHIHNSKQRFKYCDCDRQLIENPTTITISQQQTKTLVDQPKAAALSDRLLLERISLAGIARVTQVFQK